MGSMHGGDCAVAMRIYKQLVQICQREPYVGQKEPMAVVLNGEFDFRRRNRFVLQSFETFESWDDDTEQPTLHDPCYVHSFNFDKVARLNLHWRKGRAIKHDDIGEDIYECYTKRSRGDWCKMLSFSTADAHAVKRGLPLLTKEHYDTLVAESDPMAPVPAVYSEIQRLLRAFADDRNFNISHASIPNAMLNAMELESPGLMWAKARHIVPQTINGEFHKTI